MNKEIGEDRTRWEGQIQRKTGDTEGQMGREEETEERERRGVCAGEAKRGKVWKEPKGPSLGISPTFDQLKKEGQLLQFGAFKTYLFRI